MNVERIVQRTKQTLDQYGMSNVREWLETTDYFTAPASRSYHGAFSGGLMIHSYQVYKQLEHLTDRLCLSWKREKSPAIIGLLHDVCKIGLYVPQYNERGQVTGYTYDQNHSSDHAALSLRMLKDKVGLTREEELCIKYHMGEFTKDVDEHDMTYTQAVHECANVLWTHTADMYCSQVLDL